jgi:hypothetical protein
MLTPMPPACVKGNRLVGVWYHDGSTADANQRVATYTYDPLFRRIRKDVANMGDGVVYWAAIPHGFGNDAVPSRSRRRLSRAAITALTTWTHL